MKVGNMCIYTRVILHHTHTPILLSLGFLMKLVEINLHLFLKIYLAGKIYPASSVKDSKHINSRILPIHFPKVENVGIYFPVAI